MMDHDAIYARAHKRRHPIENSEEEEEEEDDGKFCSTGSRHSYLFAHTLNRKVTL